MGRWEWSNRKTVEQCLRLNVDRMTRDGIFSKGPGRRWASKWTNRAGEETDSIGYWVQADNCGQLYLQLGYTVTNGFTKEVTPLNYRIDLTTTPCYLGGVRYWFICPLARDGQACNRRVGTLYLPPNGKYFGCRQCYNLTYKCQKEHDKSVDALRKNPALLEAQLESGSLRAALAVLKVWQRI